MEILEVKNTVSETKMSLDRLNNYAGNKRIHD